MMRSDLGWSIPSPCCCGCGGVEGSVEWKYRLERGLYKGKQQRFLRGEVVVGMRRGLLRAEMGNRGGRDLQRRGEGRMRGRGRRRGFWGGPTWLCR